MKINRISCRIQTITFAFIVLPLIGCAATAAEEGWTKLGHDANFAAWHQGEEWLVAGDAIQTHFSAPELGKEVICLALPAFCWPVIIKFRQADGASRKKSLNLPFYPKYCRIFDIEKAEIKRITDYLKDLEEGLVEWDYRGITTQGQDAKAIYFP